jgi:very-short-patch-repair endonuclease
MTRMMISRICIACGKEFKTYPSNVKYHPVKYCSRECYHKHHAGKNHHLFKEKIKRKCEWCGKEFEVNESALEGKVNRGKFCSKLCSALYQGSKLKGTHKVKTIKYNCIVCGKELELPEKAYLSVNRRFCSIVCKSKYQSRERVNCKCKTCGKIFTKIRSNFNKDGNNFCSHKCHSEFNRGENNNKYVQRVKVHCKTCGKELVKRPLQISVYGNFCSHKCFGIYSTEHQANKETSIEVKIAEQLKIAGIPFIKQAPLMAITVADFYLPLHKVVIYCDGDYWHNPNKRTDRWWKDAGQTNKLSTNGFDIFRFSENNINESPHKCIEQIIEYIHMMPKELKQYTLTDYSLKNN